MVQPSRPRPMTVPAGAGAGAAVSPMPPVRRIDRVWRLYCTQLRGSLSLRLPGSAAIRRRAALLPAPRGGGGAGVRLPGVVVLLLERNAVHK